MFSTRRGPSGRGQKTLMSRHSHKDRTPPKALPSPLPSQRKLLEIQAASSLPITSGVQPVITDVELVGSFSWKDNINPTIMIPGKPPKWQPPIETRMLEEDSGIYYYDSNDARYPSFPMEPSIKAIQKQDPDFNFMDVEIVTCDFCLVRLLGFVRAEELSFRFGVELIGSTLFLVRKTNKPRETISDIYGYGHSFPEAYTTWDRDVRGSSKNQRLVNYDLCGLKCVVRFGSDGYLPGKIHSVARSAASQETEDSLDLGNISMLRLLTPLPRLSRKLELEEAGELIPQEAIFDLKTRSIKKSESVSIETFLHNLWINRVPNFILAFHEKGTFRKTDIHIIDAQEKVQTWEAKNAKHIKELSQVLRKLISIGEDIEAGTFEIRREGNGPLQIWSERPGWSALPLSMRSLFVGEMASSGSDETENNSDSDADADDWLRL